MCTEVTADDTKAIDAVVNADKKRLALMEERQRLEVEKGRPGEHHGERLKEVASASDTHSLPHSVQYVFSIVSN